MYTPQIAKRFYKEVAVSDAEAERFRILLDGRAMRTPAKAVLAVPSRPLAEALKEEWSAQEEEIDPSSMPMTALTCTGLDLVVPRRAEVVEELAGYAKADALCYQVDQPAVLVERQQALWQPLLDWAEREHGAALAVTTGLLAIEQPEAALAALRKAVAAHDDLSLGALANAIKAAGSLVVGLALSHGRLDAAGAFEAGELHETYQLELWGEDPEAIRRRNSVRADLEAAERFIGLLR